MFLDLEHFISYKKQSEGNNYPANLFFLPGNIKTLFACPIGTPCCAYQIFDKIKHCFLMRASCFFW
jgi:hypothetical protein